MGRFVSDDHKVIRADWWDDDETVTIRRFTYGDRQFLAGEYVNVNIEGNDPDEEPSAVTSLLVGRMNMAILQRGIVSWTLKREDGRLVPLTAQWIGRLEERDAEFILARINELNPSRRRSKEEQANFRDGDRDSAEEPEPASS